MAENFPTATAKVIRLVFADLITGSNTNGKQYVLKGEFDVIIEPIPADAPQDWEFGPKQKPGEWGAYRAHGFYASGHGPYAFAVGKTAAAAFEQACGHFAGKYCEWPRTCLAVVVAERKAVA